mgnify:CR=1 FL=1
MPEGLKNIRDIIIESDGIMVARGDLGVELPPETVPEVQRRVVRCCRRAGKPVVVATQMLESMITSPSPTRAEVSDVATAIYDGADAIMLSAETAAGRYPVETVTAMAGTCLGAETWPDVRRSAHRADREFQRVDETIAIGIKRC